MKKREYEHETMAIPHIGLGYDIHRFAPHRKFVLGGVTIPGPNGLDGHSDADVLLHAICDALLGAASAGDIGTHFPDSDRRYKNISSLVLLRRVGALVRREAYIVGGVDSTIILQSPKIAGKIPSMRKKIAAALNIAVGRVSVKATTNEGLGSLGRGEGCAAFAVAVLVR